MLSRRGVGLAWSAISDLGCNPLRTEPTVIMELAGGSYGEPGVPAWIGHDRCPIRRRRSAQLRKAGKQVIRPMPRTEHPSYRPDYPGPAI